MAPRAIALALALVVGAPALAAERSLAIKSGGAIGLDTNANRIYSDQAEPSSLLQATLSLDYERAGEAHAFTAAYAAGAKLFMSSLAATTLAQSVTVGYAHLDVRRMRLGVEGRGKLRLTIAGDRDYADLFGVGLIEFGFLPATSLRISLGARRYLFLPDARYHSSGPSAGALARVSPWRGHVFFALGDLSPRQFTSNACLPPPTLCNDDPAHPAPRVVRQDTEIVAAAGYSYRGRLAFQAAYEFFGALSNSYGERIWRHRVVFSGTLRIPSTRWFMTLGGTLAYVIYPDGVYLDDLLVKNDDEAQSHVAVVLARPVSERADLEFRYTFVASVFTEHGWLNPRHVPMVGITARY